MQTCFLCDLQPSFGSSGTQNAAWITHNAHAVCSDHPQHFELLAAAPVGRGRVMSVQGEVSRVRISKP